MSVRRRLAELAELHELPESGRAALARLLALLADDPTAPTTLRDPAIAVDAHVADALVGLQLAPLRAARRIADIGAGAGFPGLVLAAALPDAEVALIEASGRKCAFLERAVGAMGLDNVVIVASRAESWEEGIGGSDAITARAVAALPVLVEYAAPLLMRDGALLAWKGRRDPGDERDAAAAAAATAMAPSEVLAVHPWPGAENLHLHLYLKVGLTPNRFPRRPGIARKRPLRASP